MKTDLASENKQERACQAAASEGNVGRSSSDATCAERQAPDPWLERHLPSGTPREELLGWGDDRPPGSGISGVAWPPREATAR